MRADDLLLCELESPVLGINGRKFGDCGGKFSGSDTRLLIARMDYELEFGDLLLNSEEHVPDSNPTSQRQVQNRKLQLQNTVGRSHQLFAPWPACSIIVM